MSTKKISTEQEQAIDLLLMGKSPTEVSKELGQPVRDWSRRDPAFISELSQRRSALRETQLDQLRALAGRALEVLDEQLTNGVEKSKLKADVAIQILKLVGLEGKVSPSKPITEEEANSTVLLNMMRDIQEDEKKS